MLYKHQNLLQPALIFRKLSGTNLPSFRINFIIRPFVNQTELIGRRSFKNDHQKYISEFKSSQITRARIKRNRNRGTAGGRRSQSAKRAAKREAKAAAASSARAAKKRDAHVRGHDRWQPAARQACLGNCQGGFGSAWRKGSCNQSVRAWASRANALGCWAAMAACAAGNAKGAHVALGA